MLPFGREIHGQGPMDATVRIASTDFEHAHVALVP
jgi:hypothetical protein